MDESVLLLLDLAKQALVVIPAKELRDGEFARSGDGYHGKDYDVEGGCLKAIGVDSPNTCGSNVGEGESLEPASDQAVVECPQHAANKANARDAGEDAQGHKERGNSLHKTRGVGVIDVGTGQEPKVCVHGVLGEHFRTQELLLTVVEHHRSGDKAHDQEGSLIDVRLELVGDARHVILFFDTASCLGHSDRILGSPPAREYRAGAHRALGQTSTLPHNLGLKCSCWVRRLKKIRK